VRNGMSLGPIGASGIRARLVSVRGWRRGEDVASRVARSTAPTIEPRIALMGDIGFALSRTGTMPASRPSESQAACRGSRIAATRL
jgi:hypothetical protein